LEPAELIQPPQRYSIGSGGASCGRRFSGLMHHVEISSLEISETIVGRLVFTTRITRLDPYAKIVRKIDILEKLCNDRASVTILARTPWTLTLGRAATDIKLEAGNVWEVIANGRMAGEFTGIRWNFMLSYDMWARCVKPAIDSALVWI
jgi:hypothetical protein